MDSVTTSEIRGLMGGTESPRVSVYLSTHPRSHESEKDGLRLRHLLDDAEQRLISGGLRSVNARAMLEHARALPTMDAFWERRSEGLAILISPSVFRAVRLPEAFPEQVVVGTRFHLKPLLGHVVEGRNFLVLALSENHIRLYEGTPGGLTAIPVPGLPDGKAATLHIEGADRGAQVHASGRMGGTRKQSAIFHGQGGKADSDKEELALYCHDVNLALQPVLHGRTIPMIVAAVGSLQAAFAEKCGYRHLVKHGIDGSPDHWTVSELHAHALPVITPVTDGPRQKLVETAVHNVGRDVATNQISEILRAAVEGRVASLVLNRQVSCWGRFDSEALHTDLHLTQQPGDDDLSDLALQLTLKQGGEVCLAEPQEMPAACEALAMYRY